MDYLTPIVNILSRFLPCTSQPSNMMHAAGGRREGVDDTESVEEGGREREKGEKGWRLLGREIL